MAIPLKPSEFSKHSGFEVVEDRGERGKLDRDDVVVRDGESAPVDWNDPDFVSAREQAVKELILDPGAEFLGELGKNLEPSEKIPNFDEHRPAVRSAITTLQELVDNRELPPSIRGNASLLLGGFEGKIAGQDGNIELGKSSFRHLAQAHEIDPDNIHAWGSYGMTVLAFSHFWIGKRVAVASKKGLDIDIDGELHNSVSNLSRFPKDPAAQCYLQAILGDLVKSGKASPVEKKLLPMVEGRLEGMRADPESAPRLREIQENLRARLAEM